MDTAGAELGFQKLHCYARNAAGLQVYAGVGTCHNTAKPLQGQVDKTAGVRHVMLVGNVLVGAGKITSRGQANWSTAPVAPFCPVLPSCPGVPGVPFNKASKASSQLHPL